MIKEITQEELQECLRLFSHWDEEDADWIENEISTYDLSDLVKTRLAETEIIDTNSKTIFYMSKFQTIEGILQSSPYVAKRYQDYEHTYDNVTFEIDSLVALDECKAITSSFVEQKTAEWNPKDAREELDTRISYKECEQWNSIETRKVLAQYFNKHKWSPKDELKSRIKIQECVHFITDFVKENMDRYINYFTYEREKKNQQLTGGDFVLIVMNLNESEKHTSEYVEKRIAQLIKSNKCNDPAEETKFRIALLECEKYMNDFLNDSWEYWSKNENYVQKKSDGTNIGVDFEIPYVELEYRLKFVECQKWSSDYIDNEIWELRAENTLKSPEDELKYRIKLKYFERTKGENKESLSKEMFWKQPSIHGLHAMSKLKEELNDVGPGFCLAKWNQVSILLQTGQTHSCHHPYPHVVPISELQKNPSALHNTKFKKAQRKTMLNGGRPKECDYCWNVEDANPDSFSDRHLKSGEGWAFSDFKKIRDSDPNDDVQPKYVEISFSNQCNQGCSYCDVKSSSNWQSEITNKGHYPTSGMYNNIEWMERDGIVPIPHTQPNPYREAFWEWWPDLYPSLHTFRVTGGEPLLHRDTFQVLDYIIENPNLNPRLELSINSNLTIPDNLVDEFIDKVKYITEHDLVWNFALFTSVEAENKRAEYIRDGMLCDRFWKNVDKFLTNVPKASITLMATYNLMSVSTYDHVINNVFEMKKKHYNGKRYRDYAIILDTAYLRHPEFLQIRLLSTKWIDKIERDIELMDSMSDEKYVHIYGHGHCGFYDFEREKLRRTLDWVKKPIEDVNWLIRQRQDFIKFIDEYDKRRKKNFLETFPEMEEFYEQCKSLI